MVMKTLAVFHSRTGATKAVAERLVDTLGCDS
ncbi:MAG TPA: flavodoxin family protein [Thermoplasmatales archaeon]|nr:flavodoxin family protein [Thermoplasmatales archaeon]